MKCSNCPKDIIPSLDVAHCGLCDACRTSLTEKMDKKQRRRNET